MMKTRWFRRLAAAAAGVLLAVSVLAGSVPARKTQAASSGSVTMYRLFNQGNHEHLYTADLNERNVLMTRGWTYEGICWTTPEKSDTPVYRMYNPWVNDHLYTTDRNEYNVLQAYGWTGEGIGWYAADEGAVPVYRQFTPLLTSGSHNFTTDVNEKNTIVATGAWRDEGIAWYCLSQGHPDDSASTADPATCTHDWQPVYLRAFKITKEGHVICKGCGIDENYLYDHNTDSGDKDYVIEHGVVTGHGSYMIMDVITGYTTLCEATNEQDFAQKLQAANISSSYYAAVERCSRCGAERVDDDLHVFDIERGAKPWYGDYWLVEDEHYGKKWVTKEESQFGNEYYVWGTWNNGEKGYIHIGGEDTSHASVHDFKPGQLAFTEDYLD